MLVCLVGPDFVSLLPDGSDIVELPDGLDYGPTVLVECS